jgi:pimeloyl-ACP methyl ester carboxylesterase
MKLTWRGPGACTIAAIGVVVWLISQASAAPLNIQNESYRIPAADSGVELYIRNKHPAGVSNFPAEKILLFVYGATYPAETAFDLPLNGLSMMDYIAQQGWDVYLVDVRGYGGSTRPPEMDVPASENKPIVDTAIAV